MLETHRVHVLAFVEDFFGRLCYFHVVPPVKL